MTKRLIITIICMVLMSGAKAKSMSELWTCLPDSVIPYLDRAHRVQMMEYIKMGLKADVDNSLAEKSMVDTLTADYIHLTLNESVVMELKKLPQTGGDSLICMVTTWKGPAEESRVRFFSQSWQELDLSHAFHEKELANLTEELIQKPDTMDEKRFGELRSMIDPMLVSAHLSPNDNQLQVQLLTDLLSADDRKAVGVLIRPLFLSWNGTTFQKTE